jgi:methionine synthase II (cobalamin-independent)
VVDIRTTMVETPEAIADRIRAVIDVVPPERVWLTTDCGMKPLPRTVARLKLKALTRAAEIVRAEVS